jgi:glycosyltransferase involved in cell wall biosynthesis
MVLRQVHRAFQGESARPLLLSSLVSHRMPGTRQPLSILHVLAPAPAGGLERVVRALAAGQVKRGHRVAVAVVAEAGHPFSAALAGTGVRLEPIVVPGRAYLRERAAVREIASRLDVHIIHTHGYRADVVDGGAVQSQAVHKVTTVHGFTGGGWRNRLYETLQRRAFRRFDAVVAVSEPLARALVGWGTPEAHVRLIPNGYEAAGPLVSRADARAALGLPREGFVVGWVGRLSHEKGLDVLLASLALVRDRPITVAVIGTGRERASLEARAHAANITPALRWLGLVPDAGRLFRAFDIFALSSRTEGTPIALFEAMDAGVPVVATAVGGVPAVVSEKEALLIPSEDPVALARALRMIQDDPLAARARSLAARERLAAVYGLEGWLERYDHLYAELAGPSGQAARNGGAQ